MRFGLRCIFWLAILYHAILSERGGTDTAVRTAAEAAGAARRGISEGVDAYCRREPATCLADATRLTSLLAATPAHAQASDTTAPEPRHRRRGALASTTP